MEFKRLRLRNILCVGNTPVEIKFPSNSGITRIEGVNLDIADDASNGAGKSTIIEGILLGLYGRTLRRHDGKPLTIERLIHGGDEDATAEVELEYDNVRIVRYFNPTKVEFWVDGKQGHVASAPESRKLLEKEIKVNFDTMLNILLFGQHNMFSFLDAGEPERREIVENLMNLKEYNLYEEKARDLRRTTKQKIEILTTSHKNTQLHLNSQRDLLNKQQKALDEYRTQVDLEIAKLKKDLLGLPNTDKVQDEWKRYEDARNQLAEISKRQLAINDQTKQVDRQQSALIEQRDKELAGIKSVSEATSSIDAKIAQLDLKKSQLMSMVDAKANKVQQLKSQVSFVKTQAVSDSLAVEHSPELMGLQSQLQLIEGEGKNIKAKIQQIESNSLNADTVCPMCFGKVDPVNFEHVLQHYREDLSKLRQQFVDKQAQISIIRAGIKNRQLEITSNAKIKTDSLQLEADALIEEINQALPQIEKQYKSRLDQFKQDKEVLKASVAQDIATINAKYDKLLEPFILEKGNLESQLRELVHAYNKASLAKQPNISIADLSRIDATRQSLEQKIKEKSDVLLQNPYEEVLRSLGESVKVIEDKIALEESEIRATEALLPYYDFWATAMGTTGIKSFLIDQIVPMLNAQIDYWMQVIYHGAISVTFDKFLNVTIKNNASKKGLQCYGQGSGGERRRIDMAIMLAFRQIMKMSTGKDPSVVFFDEVAENIDGHGIQWLHDVLMDLSKNSRVYVITHNPGLSSLLQSTDKITLTKKDGATKLS